MSQQDVRLLALDVAETIERLHASITEYRARTNAAAQEMTEMLLDSKKALDGSRAMLAALAASKGT